MQWVIFQGVIGSVWGIIGGVMECNGLVCRVSSGGDGV